MTKKTLSLGAAALVLVALVAAATTWWLTERDGETRTDGTCSNGLYELTAEPEDGGLEVAFELQSTAPGERWDVRLEQSGSVLLEGVRRTDEDAELDVDVLVAESDGSTFSVEASGPGGRTCSATLER